MDYAKVRMKVNGDIRDCTACTLPTATNRVQYFYEGEKGDVRFTKRLSREEVRRMMLEAQEIGASG